MSDYHQVCSAATQVVTGKGIVDGLVFCTHKAAGVFAGVYLNDNVGAGGTSILIVESTVDQPVVIMFPERFSIRFTNGLYLTISTDSYCTIWGRQE